MNLVKSLSLAFLAANVAVIALNHQTFTKLDDDSAAINLAGRQRMLSQRMTKAAMIAVEQNSEAAKTEMSKAAAVFDSTLRAFVAGGKTVAADGSDIIIPALTGQALEIAKATLERWDRLSRNTLGETADASTAKGDLLERNAEILDLMNRMTIEIEKASKKTVADLRYVQYGLFGLAVLLGVVVFLSLSAQAKGAQQDSDSLYAALDEVSAGVLVLDSQGKIRHHNKSSLEFLALDGVSPVGKTMSSLMDEVGNGVWSVTRTGKSSRIVHVSLSKPIESLDGMRVATMFHSREH